MPQLIKIGDVTATTMKVESARDARREIDVVGLRLRNVSLQLHIDEKTLRDLVVGHIGLHVGGLLTVREDQRIAVELTPLTRTVTLILERSQVDDLRDQCREALGEIHFGDLKNFGA